MPIDPSISDLTWLTQNADPAKDLAAGASVGGHIAQSRLGFASLAQRAQEFQQEQSMRERQLGMQIAQEPLKQTLMQQEADLNAAHLATVLQQRQDTISATKAFSGLAGQVSPLLAEGKIDAAQAAILAAGSSNAFLLNDPRYKNLYEFTTKAQEAKLELQKNRNITPMVIPLTDDRGQTVLDAAGNPMTYLQKGPGSGEILNKGANLPAGQFATRTNPVTGKPEAIFYQTPNSAQLVKNPEDVLPEEVRASSYLAQKKQELRTLNNALLESGSGEGSQSTEQLKSRIAVLGDEIDSLEARHGMQETSVTTPEGTTVRIGKVGQKQPGDLTAAETTKSGEDLTATSNALRSVMRLKGQMGSNVVGLSPRVQSVIFDEVLAQFDPALANKARTAGRQNIRLATQQILGELNNRGRLSNQELQAVRDAMPSLSAAESAPNAQVKLDELSLVLAEKGASAAQSLKRPITPEILQTLSDLFPPGKGEQAMAEEVKRGALSRETAIQVRKWQKMKGL